MTPKELKRLEEIEQYIGKFARFPQIKADGSFVDNNSSRISWLCSKLHSERREALEEVKNWIRDRWLAAYPTDIFVPPTKEECELAHKALRAIGLSIDKFSGEMGRYVATCLIEEIRQITEEENE